MQSYLAPTDLKKLRDLYGMTDSQILGLFKKYMKQGGKLKKKQVRKARKNKKGKSSKIPFGGEKSEFKGVSSVQYTPGLGNLAQAFQTAEALRQKYSLLADAKVGGHHTPDTRLIRNPTNPQNDRIADHFIQTIRAQMGDAAPPQDAMRDFVDKSIQDGDIRTSFNPKLQKVSFTLPRETESKKVRRPIDLDEQEEKEARKLAKAQEKALRRPDQRPLQKIIIPPDELAAMGIQSFGAPPQPDVGIAIPPPPPVGGLGLFGIASSNLSPIEEDAASTATNWYGGSDEFEEVDESMTSRRNQSERVDPQEFSTPARIAGDPDEDTMSRLTDVNYSDVADDEGENGDDDQSWYTPMANTQPVTPPFKTDKEHSTPVSGISGRIANFMRRGGGGKGGITIDPEINEDEPMMRSVRQKGELGGKAKALAASKTFVDSMRNEDGVVPPKSRKKRSKK